jgi:hypothetical protein
MSAERGTTQQTAYEAERKARLGVPVLAGGILYLLGAIIVANQLQGLPTVGVVQGLEPALTGHATSAVSPRAQEVLYLSHHTFGLISGGVLQAIGFAFLTVALLFLLEATSFRAPAPSQAARWLVLVGGAGTAAMEVIGQVVRTVRTKEFASAHIYTNHAVERAVYAGTANVLVEILTLVLPILLVVGMVLVLVRATRVGLIPRWMRTLGVISAVLLLPFFTATLYTLQVVPALWMAALGILFMGRLPSGVPPAWETGDSVPWPSPAGRGGPPAPDVAAAEGNGHDAGATALDQGTDEGEPGEEPSGEEAETVGGNGARASSSGRRRKRRRGGRR